MKKIIFLSLFCLVGLFGTAQVTVGNSTASPILVGVQFTTGGCTPTADTSEPIPPGGSFLFTPPPGMTVLRVGASGVPGDDFEFSPCTACYTGPATVYTFDWSPDCSHVKIY